MIIQFFCILCPIVWTYYVLPVGIIFTAPLNKNETVSLAYLMQLLFDATLIWCKLSIFCNSRNFTRESRTSWTSNSNICAEVNMCLIFIYSCSKKSFPRDWKSLNRRFWLTTDWFATNISPRIEKNTVSNCKEYLSTDKKKHNF